VLAALITFAAEESEPSKVPYYVAGGMLAAFAVIVAVIGIARHENFPPTPGAARAVMGIAVLLVVATMASAVLTG
jgi:drug/metabolite transporter (DMT)-like permease